MFVRSQSSSVPSGACGLVKSCTNKNLTLSGPSTDVDPLDYLFNNPLGFWSPYIDLFAV
jgi:hypothetical protein